MIDLSRPALGEEIMDSPDLAQDIYASVLSDLARVNNWTMAARPTIGFLDRIARRGDTLRILDVGFGGGDMLRKIARWAQRHGVRAELTGIDLNPRSAQIADTATPPQMQIDFLAGDYRDLEGRGWDVVISNLVAHHMGRDSLVDFVRFMEREARCGWFINDLMRHRVAYLVYPSLAKLMRWHPIVRQDGQLSIARSFRPDEWSPLLDEAGATSARVFRTFPFRLCVERCR